MGFWGYLIKRLFTSVPLILGVTLLSFVLMVYFGPDKTYEMLGKNPTPDQIERIRDQLGYNRPFIERYGEYLVELATFDFGNSDSSGEKVSSMLSKAVPISLGVTFPGFILGNLLGLALALVAAYHRSGFTDKFIMGFSVFGMSISLLIVVITFQILFCSTYGLDIFPVQGWEINGIGDYLNYVTIPTLSLAFVALGYNTRFYRAIFVEEMTKEHVRTAKAFGCGPVRLFIKHVLQNSLIPILTRIIFALPFIVIAGALVVETYFAIPGVGLLSFDAITSGDLPVVKAVVGCTIVLYTVVVVSADILYRLVDPRIELT